MNAGLTLRGLDTTLADWCESDMNLGDEAAGVFDGPLWQRREAAIRRLQARRRWRRIAAALVCAAGLAMLAAGSSIHAKAWLAQRLIERAWDRNLAEGRPVAKPWGWADTTPVARIGFERQQRSLIVLSGDSGRVLAFGPGHRVDTPLPGGTGNAVVSGHRDTHFALLRDVAIDDPIDVESLDGRHRRYRVDGLRIVDKSRIDIAADQGRDELTLVTCWPFDAPVPGGRWRLVVSARPDPALAPTAARPAAATIR